MTIDFAAGTYNVTVNGTLLGYAHRLFRTPNDRCTAMYFIGNYDADNHPVCIDDISMTFYVRNWSTKTSGYNTFGSLSPLHSPSLIIDAGAAKTTDPNMTLAFSCTNATSMNLSLDNSTWLPGMNYTASGYYDVGTTCGNITIYVRYYNASTGDYAYAHDDILFTFNSTITIIGYNETSQGWDDPVETNALTVLLNISSPNASWMEFGYTSDTGPFDVGPLAYNTSLYYTLPCTMNGGVLVYARFTIPINGTDYYEYVNDTINMNGSVPNLTITYPVEGATYTSVQWGADHTMTLTGITDSTFTIAMNTSCEFYTYIDTDVPYLSYSIDADLQPYVWFDDTNYTITLNVTNCFGYQNLVVNFTIGDPLTDLPVHISLADLTPIRENFSQLARLDEGVRFDIMSTEPNGIWYRVFVSDWDGNALVEQDDTAILDTVNGWQSKEYYSSRFYSRSFYKAWVVIGNSYNWSAIQFDDLYGTLEVQYVSFNDQPLVHYIFNSTDISLVNSTQSEGRYMLLTGNFTGDNATIIESFTGVSWGFGTFAIGDVIPFHSIGSSLYDAKNVYADDWGKKYDEMFPGLGLFIGLMVILFFSILPILITHTFPPLTIEMFFMEMGAVIAYAMGLFPLWIFEVALIALLMAVFYKIFNWYRSMYGVSSFADTPVAQEGVKGGKFLKGQASKLGKAIKEEGTRRGGIAKYAKQTTFGQAAGKILGSRLARDETSGRRR
jgi:membrane protein implicated in regulation of membrane protease activity